MEMGPQGLMSPNSSRRAYKMLNNYMPSILEGKFRPIIAQMEVIRRDGMPVVVESTVSILYNRDKMATKILGITRDITERKKAETDREKMQDRLRHSHKMEAIGTLAGGIAHDFNNILSGIFGYTELALRKLSPSDPVSGYMQELLSAAKRARGLINQILTLSCQQDHELKPISIGPIIEEVLRLISVSLPVNIAVHTEINAMCDVINANSVQIHQIITNLCTNAVHAMKERGGLLGVRLENVDVNSSLSRKYPELGEGQYLRLEVSDTGHGIPEDIVDKIFDPFFTTKEKGEGSGLGLSVIHGIVKSHYGAVYVASKMNEGTSFEVLLPLGGGSIDKTDIEEIAPVPEGDETILLIDDEVVLANMEKEMLEDLGYDVITRTSSVEALELFRRQPQHFDLVITDQTMPNMSGAALAKEIRDIRQDIPVILCTGFSENISQPKARSMGINEMLFKPITTRDLAETVRRVLDGVITARQEMINTGGRKKEEAFAGKKVLIADDLVSNLSLIKRMLAALGCESETVTNGEEALRALKSGSFNLVFMDISMPVMDGLEATRKIRMELDSNVPVVAITGKDLESNRETFLTAGINDFLMKPISIDGLKNMLRKWTR
jgi:CheY-like chemotaxis protein